LGVDGDLRKTPYRIPVPLVYWQWASSATTLPRRMLCAVAHGLKIFPVLQ
jgi:hypothetical protein